MAPDRSLELTREEMADMVSATTDRVLEHIESLPDQPAANVRVDDRFEHLREQVPEEPTPLAELLDLLFEDAIPYSINGPHPGNLSYIPSGGLFHAAVADLIANAINRYVGAWAGAPALARLEGNVVEWFCEMVGYPDGAFGLLTSGGSIANLVATITARRERLPDDFSDGMIYTSDQAHHSVTKAAVLAGFPRENVRLIPSDEDYRIRIDALEAAVEADRDAGKRPFLLVGSAGTTNTGAVDDLDELADLAACQDLWLHADAAYGGFFVLTDDGREQLAGLPRCDSITLDPHKGLFLPYGTGALLVRDGNSLERAHAVSADYMSEHRLAAGYVDFSQLGPELSRDFRGLRVWLPLRMHGVAPFRANLAEKLDLSRWVASELRDVNSVQVVADPQLSTLAFRVEPPGVTGEPLDNLNRAVLERINQYGRVHLSATTVDGRFTPRVCVLSFRTHRKHVEQCVEDVERAVAEILQQPRE
ncbi:pyridoxal phosphate-dependent decarboxylase family protein [Haloarchaeobius litoreus]|uniref:Pyridoxal phosphate-dependent decarboxylase family protein n=1 Tax=Haloarchaeobius litoreus TaxID=755306 RepID=A0ABD6DG19_9EURY|nr:aminotransferase class I/II-fold pyridoxal phosphate-dependent enzyme [Haloarchaeobius litoreus]